MIKPTHLLKALALLLFFALSIPLQATDGYFSIGYGTRHKGLVGAGAGLYYVSIVGGNPAGNVLLGNQYAVGFALFVPIREYQVLGNPSMKPNTFGLMPALVESDSKIFPIPNIGANWNLTEKDAIGLSIYANGGMNTNYPASVFFDQSSTTTGVNLSQLFGELTYSREITEGHSLGVSGLLGYQMFEAKGLNAFGSFGLSQDPTKLSDNGTDNSLGFGFKVGYLGHFGDKFSLGATYQSRIFMSEFKDYSGLFAEDGDFDIPSSWTVGITYAPTEDWLLLADFKQIRYSEVKAIANPMNPQTLFPGFIDSNGQPMPNPNFVPLGAENGAGFGWQDMNVFKIAAEYSGLDNWILRGGYSYGKQPIPEEEVLFNILAPGIIENHLALGFSREVGQQGNMLHFSFNYAFNNSVQAPNPLDPEQEIKLSMQQFDVEVGFSF